MIDLERETLITLSEAARLLPRNPAGRRVHTSTIYRWSKHGLRGVVLETVQAGGRRCTTRLAVLRFVSELSGLTVDGDPIGFPYPDTPSEALLRAIEGLDEMGV